MTTEITPIFTIRQSNAKKASLRRAARKYGERQHSGAKVANFTQGRDNVAVFTLGDMPAWYTVDADPTDATMYRVFVGDLVFDDEDSGPKPLAPLAERQAAVDALAVELDLAPAQTKAPAALVDPYSVAPAAAYVRTERKTYYELASNSLNLDELAALVEAAGDMVTKRFVNANSCAVVRGKAIPETASRKRALKTVARGEAAELPAPSLAAEVEALVAADSVALVMVAAPADHTFALAGQQIHLRKGKASKFVCGERAVSFTNLEDTIEVEQRVMCVGCGAHTAPGAA